MPVELLRLNLQLESLQILYDDAIRRNAPIGDLKQIKDQIQILEVLINDRKQLIRNNESLN